MQRLTATSAVAYFSKNCGTDRDMKRTAVDSIGFDLGKVSSQVCILTEDGELIERRIRTDRDHFNELLSSRPPARILVEASTESEWVARHLESLGHEVIVADPNLAPMYATRSRKVNRPLLPQEKAQANMEVRPEMKKSMNFCGTA